jgi:hypothetical protein
VGVDVLEDGGEHSDRFTELRGPATSGGLYGKVVGEPEGSGTISRHVRG